MILSAAIAVVALIYGLLADDHTVTFIGGTLLVVVAIGAIIGGISASIPED